MVSVADYENFRQDAEKELARRTTEIDQIEDIREDKLFEMSSIERKMAESDDGGYRQKMEKNLRAYEKVVMLIDSNIEKRRRDLVDYKNDMQRLLDNKGK